MAARNATKGMAMGKFKVVCLGCGGARQSERFIKFYLCTDQCKVDYLSKQKISA